METFGSMLSPWHSTRPVVAPAVALVAWRTGWCNGAIAAAWRQLGIDATRMTPHALEALTGPQDVVLNRLDVTRTLDGIEPGLDVIRLLERRGARVLNRADALVATHDKRQTADRLAACDVPHPRTVSVPGGATRIPDMDPPLVLKPRFGSWGRDVSLCRTAAEVSATLLRLSGCEWFSRTGAVAQTFVPHASDLRLVMAAGELIGVIERRPAPGEWRTNFSLGGSRRVVTPPADAVAVAGAAVAALGDADLVGVDLIGTPGGHVVIEVNGAVDFDRAYSLPGRDAYADAAELLRLPVVHRPGRRWAPPSVSQARRVFT